MCHVMMEYKKPPDDFYKCPICGFEGWPGDTITPTDDEVSKLMREMAPTHKPKECLPAGGPILKGGSKSKVGKNEKMSKKTLSQINQGLNGKCSSFDN
jgi:hypothetical protein